LTINLAEKYSKLSIFARDYTGDTALHIACRNRNLTIVKMLFDQDPDKCLLQNYKGQTPVYIATESEDTRILELFAAYKWQAL
jgi:ankyrin repeat protein